MKTVVKQITAVLLCLFVFAACKKDRIISNGAISNGATSLKADAGPDQIITLPQNNVLLDGSKSTNSIGIVSSYNWVQVSGTPATIVNRKTVQTQVTELSVGVNQFELTVTDAFDKFSKDTVLVTVTSAVIDTSSCNNTNRPHINARLIPIGTLSKPRHGMAIAAAGNKIVFAGGGGTPDCPECWGSSRVDIYDILSNTWSSTELTVGRGSIGAIAAGNKIFFAGGQSGDGAIDTYYNNIDIYDASSNTWTVKYLSEARGFIAAGTAGDQVFFAGGEKNINYDCSDKVDIYNLQTNSWSASTLSVARAMMSEVTVNNKIYFAGGAVEDRYYTPSAVIDVFDNTTKTWSSSRLSQPMNLITGVTSGSKIYWASGCTVEMRDVNTSGTDIQHLYRRAYSGLQSVVKDNFVLFLGDRWSGENKFDIYNTLTNTWSIGELPISIESAISYNNTVYATDGAKVYRLEF